jgi:hygromycin-B 4-O-kinase
MKETFLKEKLRAAGVPMRDVIGEGAYENLKYTISKKERGTKLACLGPNEFKAILPSVFELFLAFASIDLSETQGYGWFDSEGNVSETTWQAHLSRIKDEEPGYFFGEWHALFTTTFLEQDRFARYYSRMMDLLEGLAIPRALVHGSFSAYTALAERGEITAVRDWQDARIGDTLFDVASIDFWPTGYNLADMFMEFCADRGIRYVDYRRRIAGYKYYQALGSMIYFAKIDNRSAYQAVIEIADCL